ncbi:MAG: hypothetical protein LQ351_002918 [Letrouitia transgressa]|nr:MAG: hypothetical protein LQ351_002918 [Letrouitia transgressa]
MPRIRLPIPIPRLPRTTRPFTSTAPHRSSDAHTNYEPPSGWLWGVPPGEKREREGWEYLWIVGFFGSLGAAAVAYAYKPDTS